MNCKSLKNANIPQKNPFNFLVKQSFLFTQKPSEWPHKSLLKWHSAVLFYGNDEWVEEGSIKVQPTYGGPKGFSKQETFKGALPWPASTQ